MIRDTRPRMIPTLGNIMRAGVRYAPTDEKLAIMRAASWYDIIQSNRQMPWKPRYQEKSVPDDDRLDEITQLNDRFIKYFNDLAYLKDDLWEWLPRYRDPVTRNYYFITFTQHTAQVDIPDANGLIRKYGHDKVDIWKPRIMRSAYARMSHGRTIVGYPSLKKRLYTLVLQTIDIRNQMVPACKRWSMWCNQGRKYLDYVTVGRLVEDASQTIPTLTFNDKIIEWPDL